MSPDRRPTDADGMRVSPASSGPARAVMTGLVVAAVLVIGASALAVWWLRRDAGNVAADGTVAAPIAAAEAAPPMRVERARVQVVPRRAPADDRRPPAADHAAGQPSEPTRSHDDARAAAPAGARAASSDVPAASDGGSAPEERGATTARDDREIERTVDDVVAGMRAAGDTRGLAAIPPRGTNPVKSGIVVPKDYELPEGYIRHYQTTDDGKRLEAILMFSPDYDFVDEHGNRIALPADGIVPPDMAPAGIPLRTLDVPPGDAPRRPSRPADDH